MNDRLKAAFAALGFHHAEANRWMEAWDQALQSGRGAYRFEAHRAEVEAQGGAAFEIGRKPPAVTPEELARMPVTGVTH